jgi:hypothetical protein
VAGQDGAADVAAVQFARCQQNMLTAITRVEWNVTVLRRRWLINSTKSSWSQQKQLSMHSAAIVQLRIDQLEQHYRDSDNRASTVSPGAQCYGVQNPLLALFWEQTCSVCLVRASDYPASLRTFLSVCTVVACILSSWHRQKAAAVAQHSRFT